MGFRTCGNGFPKIRNMYNHPKLRACTLRVIPVGWKHLEIKKTLPFQTSFELSGEKKNKKKKEIIIRKQRTDEVKGPSIDSSPPHIRLINKLGYF